MDISTAVDAGKGIRRHTVIGSVDVDELKEYLRSLYESPDVETHMHVLWDLREADVSSVSSDDVRLLMEYVGNKWGGGGDNKAALVVSTELVFGLSRMYQMMMEGVSSNKISIFKDIEAATAWVGEHSE